jgi:hypothetical protein
MEGLRDMPETPENVQAGDTVKLSNPGPGEEEARYVVTEWNGDRGFVRLICKLPIPPVELLRSGDVVVVAKSK